MRRRRQHNPHEEEEQPDVRLLPPTGSLPFNVWKYILTLTTLTPEATIESIINVLPLFLNQKYRADLWRGIFVMRHGQETLARYQAYEREMIKPEVVDSIPEFRRAQIMFIICEMITLLFKRFANSPNIGNIILAKQHSETSATDPINRIIIYFQRYMDAPDIAVRVQYFKSTVNFEGEIRRIPVVDKPHITNFINTIKTHVPNKPGGKRGYMESKLLLEQINSDTGVSELGTQVATELDTSLDVYNLHEVDKHLFAIIYILIAVKQWSPLVSMDQLDVEFDGRHVPDRPIYHSSFTSLKSCISCGSTENVSFQCGNCNNAYYCNFECQQHDWEHHSEQCAILE